ncbi:GntR family transcriptional regulator [Haloechinothrix alba]|uniref:GntR family transcriptional regulator n=1 Tax=Haloechinothrix alba TaxID=664784 RepID=A0A238WSQ4_9PSEU|nr:GntR family transcriptional regulator [Haloechinothrix alba]SNR49421.1 GntR family transcriptional regulator [Haloechinothrix alba]
MATRWSGTPAYLQIAADYRGKILDGSLAPGAKLPSESRLMSDYGVSRMVVKMALNVLRNEGLILGHQGKGSFVKESRRVVRDSTGRYSRHKPHSSSPFTNDAAQSSQRGDREYASKKVPATEDLAVRLGIEPDAELMQTDYRYFADGAVIQVARSWEPLAITGGTSIELPEESPAVGVIARMDLIDQRVDEVVERVHARPARPDETERLELPAQSVYVLAIERTHYVGDQPVETCDITFPGDRYELTYRIPVDS